MPPFQFEPSQKQASHLNTKMQSALIASLTQLADAAEPLIGRAKADQLKGWCQNLQSGQRVSPLIYGAYFDLVTAIQADDAVLATALIDEISTHTCSITGTVIRALGETYTPAQTDRLKRFMGNGKTDASGIAPPDPRDVERFSASLVDAFDWIDAHAPDFSAEIRSIIHSIILVAPDGASPNTFEGGTCFKLWGALFLNAECEFTLPELVTSLAHEEGHAVLFGACREQMLVENPDTELYWSAIRQSRRPMEGIFHATFVSARMIHIMTLLLNFQPVGGGDRNKLERSLYETTKIYMDGLNIVRKHARLTDTGAEVLDAMLGHTPLLATQT